MKITELYLHDKSVDGKVTIHTYELCNQERDWTMFKSMVRSAENRIFSERHKSLIPETLEVETYSTEQEARIGHKELRIKWDYGHSDSDRADKAGTENDK